MNRRTYLGLTATGVVGGFAGCSTDFDGREYPPYPDSETVDLSGDGEGRTDPFEIVNDGPTLVDAEHTGSESFTVVLGTPITDANSPDETADGDGANETTNETNTTNETTTDDGIEQVSTVVSATGPYNGRTLHAVGPDSYVLDVIEADDEWTATIYDLPAYDDGVGVSLPIEREGELEDVIGPINFGDVAETDAVDEAGDVDETRFEFSASGEGVHRLILTDREADDSLTVTDFEGESEDSVSNGVSGVGYLEVRSFGSWSLSVSK